MPDDAQSRIGINAHLLASEPGYRRAGVHHYILKVLSHLPQNDGVKTAVFTNYTDPMPNGNQFQFIPASLNTDRRLFRILWEQTALPWALWRKKIDLLHSMAFVIPFVRPCPTIVTIFDLSFLHYPEQFPSLQRRYLQTQTKRSSQQATHVVTISDSGRQDVHTYFNVPLEKISVIYPGVETRYNPLLAKEISAFRAAKNLPKRFILHVGTLQPRKNIPLLIKAMSQLDDQSIPLYLIGGKGWLYDDIFAQVAELGLQDRVHFVGYAPDEEMVFWYNAASLLVFPSVYEGFGMPIVEAMACGTPVVASNCSSIPEAAGDAARLFDPTDADQLANEIGKILHDEELSSRLRDAGQRQARRFSWERAGRETAALYSHLLQQREATHDS